MPSVTAPVHTPLVRTRPNALQFGLKVFARTCFRIGARVQVEGAERIPADGPYIVAINHLHFWDVAIMFATVPHYFAGLAASHWRDHRFVWWLCGQGARLIPVNRERLDPHTLATADRWLRHGGVLLVAPEGTRSGGALIRGQAGIAYLAARSRAPVVPMVMWGQENWKAAWAHLRRPLITVRVGNPLVLDDLGSRPRGEALVAGTDRIMLALAELLPPAYRGVYGAHEPGPADPPGVA